MPTAEEIVCAIIGRAIYGGCVNVEIVVDRRLPVARDTHRVSLVGTSHRKVNVFYRELYAALLGNHPKRLNLTIDDDPLVPADQADLEVRVPRFRDSSVRETPIIVVTGCPEPSALAEVSAKLRIPILVEVERHDPVASRILRMDVDKLIAYVKEFHESLTRS